VAQRLSRCCLARPERPAETDWHSALAPRSLAANGENVSAALRFIDGQTGAGGTELLPALRYALAQPTEEGRARTFVVVTDEAFGISRMFSLYADTSPDQFRIFRTLSPAMEWIGLPAAEAWPAVPPDRVFDATAAAQGI